MTKLLKKNIEQSSSTAEEEKKELMPSLDLAKLAIDAALNVKALEPELLHVENICSYTEYLLVLSGRSERQVDAIAESIKDSLRLKGRKPLGKEGMGHWSLLDYGDLVIHVFHHPLREHYDLESLWSEAEHIKLDIPAEARIGPDDRYSY